MSTKPRKISLRALAREVDATHSSLSEAVRDGRITRGVRTGADGRVEVLDADAAAAQWREVHIVRVDEMVRREEAGRRTAKQAAAVLAERHVIFDRHGYDWTAQSLLASWEAHNVLVDALIAVTLDGQADPKAAGRRLMKAACAQLPRYAPDTEVIVSAKRVLKFAILYCLNPEDSDDGDEEP